MSLSIDGKRPLAGIVTPPPDKSISHRALMMAALGRGSCTIAPLSEGEDNRATRRVLEKLGVRIDVGEGVAVVEGLESPERFLETREILDCQNSGTTLRMMAGILAAAPSTFTLSGDPSLSGRPMSRLLPLETMGAVIRGREVAGKIYPPITIRGGGLVGRRHELAVASAQVKSALLFAGLFAEGETSVREPSRSRDHTERMLRRLGVGVREDADGTLTVSTRRAPWSVDRIDVAPDPSSAAFLVAAAVLTESTDLAVTCSVNPTRTGFFDALVAMGIQLDREPAGEIGGEPIARIRVTGGRLEGTVVAGDLALRAIDELPLLAAVAAFASGRTVIQDAAELRVKESDRISATARMLSGFGVRSTETRDGLIIEGGRPSPGGADSSGDHRIAMSATVMALGIEGRSTIRGIDAVDVSYPRFFETLAELGAEVARG
jgi:3-phosphoshikimate 1-carboxyvinyltransferase